MQQFVITFTVLAACTFCGGAVADDTPKRSPELQVLERFIGTWDELVTDKSKAEKSTSVTKRKWSSGGRFVLAEGAWQPAKSEFHHLITYDPGAKVYRSWYLEAAGSFLLLGTWDEKTRTMTWRGTDAAENKTVGTHRFIDKDHAEWSTVMTDRDGKVVVNLSAKQTRRTKPKK